MDPLLRAINDLRDQLDHLVDEQHQALEQWFRGLETTSLAVERPTQSTASHESSALWSPRQEISRTPSQEEIRVSSFRVVDPAPSLGRSASREVGTEFRDDDQPGPPPLKPTAPIEREPVAEVRSDDPSARLEALAKRLDQRLRRSGSTPDSSSSDSRSSGS